MKIRIISLLLACCLMTGLLPISATAAATTSGTCGDALTWFLDGGVLTISGHGTMYDYYDNFARPNEAPWVDLAFSTAIIEDGVASIGNEAFGTCSSLVSISIPGSVTSIGYGAFNNCHTLATVEIPGSVKSIGGYAFGDCGNLVVVKIADGVVSIGSSAFSNCGIVSIDIPDSVLSIGEWAFSSCSLNSASIGNGVVSISNHAFRNNGDLTSITIGTGVKSIGANAFNYCDSLSDVYYQGSQAEWNRISISNEGNDALLNANIHFGSPVTPATSTLSIGSGKYSPGTLNEGDSYSLSGKITSNHEITQVTVGIYDADGNPTSQVKTVYPNTTIYDIHSLDSDIRFGTLSGSASGTRYSFIVTATDASGTVKVLLNNKFTVRSAAQSTECKTHKYTSATGDVCTVCGDVYEPELVSYNKTLYAAVSNAAVRNQPYAKAGTLVQQLAKGKAVNVTHYFYNALENKWYLTEDGTYIYSERLTATVPKTYTITFYANGSGVSNLPRSGAILEGVRHSIPGKVSGVPTRPGYTFLGYSTKSNATTAEYQPGTSITMTKDITLYAVWEKIETNLASVPGVAQNQNGDQGTCTSAATAVILARRLLVDGKYDETFTYRDVRQSCNNSFRLANMTNGMTTYSLKKETLSSVRGNLKLIVNTTIPYLLDEHPEGIVVYFDYTNSNGTERPHAIVLSDYEVLSNGKYQLYAYDSGSSKRLGRRPVEETWLWTDALDFTNSNTYEDLFAHLNDDYNFGATGVCVWYIDKEM